MAATMDCNVTVDLESESLHLARYTLNDKPSAFESLDSWETNLSSILLTRLKSQESKHYRPCLNYLSYCAPYSSEYDRVSEIWRQKVCEWSYQVIDHYNFNREVVFIALNYLDRMVALLAAKDCIRKTEFRLIAVTSLYLAVKLHGVHGSNDGIRRKLRISSFHELSERCFSIEQIEEMEAKMLQSFNWFVNPPTPLTYIDSMLSMCPAWHVSVSHLSSDVIITSVKDLALYFTELSVAESRFTFMSSTSVVSYAAVLLAMRSMKGTASVPGPVYNEFINRVALAMAISPDDSDVTFAMKMLKEMCPDIIMPEDNVYLNQILAGNESKCSPGKASPVCVMDVLHDDSSPGRRKRGRGENIL